MPHLWSLNLSKLGIPMLRQVRVPVFYNGMRIPLGLRADLLVADTAILEIKAIPTLFQLLTCLRKIGLPVRLLLNFHAMRLNDGLKRFVASGREAPSAALLLPPCWKWRKNERAHIEPEGKGLATRR